MDLAFEATDKRGRYQNLIILVVILMPITSLIISAGYPFLTANPVILCREKEEFSSKFRSCKFEDICGQMEKYEIEKVFDKSIHNWGYEFDLICHKSFYLPLIGTSFFMGAIIGSFLLAPIPDNYGRLPVFKGILLLNIFVQFNLLFAVNIHHVIVVSMLAGITSYTSSLMSLFITEVIDRQISGLIMSLRSASFGFVGCFLSLFFMYVNSMKVLFICSSIISIFVYFIVIRYFVESPRWLNSANRVLEAVEAFRGIAKVNKTEENFNKFLEVNSNLINQSAAGLSSKRNSYSIYKVFMFASQRRKLLLLIYMWFGITFCFYGLFTNLDHPGGNIFIESMVTYGAESIAELVSGWCSGIVGRVIMIELLSYMGGIGYILYFIFDNKILKTSLIFLTSFGFSGALNILYIYTPETFPTSIRSMTFGFLFLISRSAAVIIPIVSKLSSKTPILLGLMSILAGFVASKLEETLGKEMLDDIPEVRRTYSVLSQRKVSSQNLDVIRNSLRFRQTIVSDEYFKLSYNNYNNYNNYNEEKKSIGLSP